MTQTRESRIAAIVAKTYQSETPTIINDETNPFLLAAIAGDPVSQFETVPGCHPECVYERLVDVRYSDQGYCSLMGETTCGDFVIWQD